jgi:hypothetical protein
LSVPDSFTTSTVAEICGVCRLTVAKWHLKGQLRGRLVPGSKHRRFSPRDVELFLILNGMQDRMGAFRRARQGLPVRAPTLVDGREVGSSLAEIFARSARPGDAVADA